MKGQRILLFTWCLISCGCAKPATVYLGYQDSLGQYSFGYSAPGSARSEVRTLNGATRGAYSYVDGAGAIQSAEYVADGENGFRVVATNLPQAPLPVQDTAEVIAARTAHLQAVEEAKKAEESVKEEEEKIGAKNIFLQGIKEEENTETKSGDITKEESKEGKQSQGEPIGAKSVKDIKEATNEEAKNKKQSNSQVASKDVIEITSSRSAQEVFSDAGIPAIPVIPSHVVVPHILNQPAVPVFRVSPENHEVKPSANEKSPSIQGSPSCVSKATLKIKSGEPIEPKRAPGVAKEEPKLEEQVDANKAVIPPVNVLPLSPYPSILRYASPAAFHYITYNIL